MEQPFDLAASAVTPSMPSLTARATASPHAERTAASRAPLTAVRTLRTNIAAAATIITADSTNIFFRPFFTQIFYVAART